MITCGICGNTYKGLLVHLARTHKMQFTEYLDKYPEQEKDVLELIQKLKTTASTTFKNREFSQVHRDKISAARKAHIGWKHKPETLEKMSKAWDSNREQRSMDIKIRMNTPEAKLKCSEIQKERIARDGYHLARGKETGIEKFIRERLENKNHKVIKQKGTKRGTLKTIRFFDMYIPSLNLVIETDGEHWHNNQERLLIDIDKTKAALSEGYVFLRLSDKHINIRKNQVDLDLLDYLLFAASPESKLEHSNKILNDRIKFLGLQESVLLDF
jgi:very-short-patch-repair endonuclease